MTRSRKKRGRPAWKPSRATRQQVQTMAGMGLLPAEIALVLDVTVKTLQKYCARELRTAAPQATAAVALALYKQATRPERPNARAAMFWLRCRAGWVEADKPRDDAAKGKKEHQAEAAAKVVASSRFRPSKPPRLVVVGNTAPPPTELPK